MDKAIPSKPLYEIGGIVRHIIIDGEINPFYLISKEGRVYNVEGKELTQFITRNGYMRVKLSRGNIKRGMYLVHRLVASTYIVNPKNYPIVNHLNSVRHDNRVDNLEWCNNSKNQLQRYEIHKGTKSKEVIQYTLEGEYVATWETPRRVFEALGIQAQNISKVCRGERKSCGGYVWRYKL